MVELRYGQVADKAPGISPVLRDVQSPVVPVKHKLSVLGMYPPGVMIGVYAVVGAVGRHQLGEILTTVLGNVDIGEDGVKPVLILRVDVDFRIIKWAVTDSILIVDFFPFKTTVLGFVERVLFGFYQGVDDIGTTSRNGDPDTTEITFRETVLFGNLFPVFPAVVGHVESAALASGFEEPGIATVFPHRGEQFIRIRRIHDEVRCPGLFVYI